MKISAEFLFFLLTFCLFGCSAPVSNAPKEDIFNVKKIEQRQMSNETKKIIQEMLKDS